MKPLIIFQVILFLLISVDAAVVNIGELSREEKDPVIPIEIVSGTPEIGTLARRAFKVHGAYELVAPEDAHFNFCLEKEGPNAVILTIRSGKPSEVKFQQSVYGKTLSEVVLKACDLAVEKTLGKVGFFAGKIAFVGGRGGKKDLYTSDLFFNHVRQLTDEGVDIVGPRFSADGGRIVYTSYFKGCPDIYVIDLLTRERKTLAAYSGSNVGGVFNPAGDKVAMVLSSSGNAELYTANANGRNPKRLTTTRGLEAAPAWSADGKKIFFSSDDQGAPQIYVIHADGGGMQRVATNISRYCDEPAPNPLYENLLAFTAASGKSFQIAVYDFKEKKSTFITQGTEDHIEPVWLNDGRHLIVTRRNRDIQQLYLLDSQTGKSSRLHSPELGNAAMATFVYLK